jgi:hypothetical protein
MSDIYNPIAATGGGGAGTGDVVSNTATSVDSEVAIFSGTTGKIIKRASGSGLAKLTSGVLTTVTAPSGTVVGDTDTQTLTNKLLVDNTTFIIDETDATKKAQFQVSGISAGTTRTYILPNANTTLVGDDATQTLTNKTLTTPTIGSFANAAHNHTNAAGGGQLTDAALSAAVGTAKGGTGLTSFGSSNQVLGVNNAAGALEYKTITAGTNVTVTHGANSITIASSGGAGGYATIAEEGSSLTQRALLNFVGTGITAADDAGNSRTNVTVVPSAILGASNTDSLPEGPTNLYFTNERVDDRVAALVQNGTGLTWTYADVSNTFTGNVSLSTFTTADLAENTNLYYTAARFNSAFSAKTTDNLIEGSLNLYYTDERAQDTIGAILTDSATIDFTYNDATPSLTGVVKTNSIDTTHVTSVALVTESDTIAANDNDTTWPTSAAVIDYVAANSGNSLQSISQTAHGLSAGNLIKSNGTDNQYAKAQADSASNAEIIGYVTSVTNANAFVYQPFGWIITNNIPAGTPGSSLFLDPSTAGGLTVTEPSAIGQISKPVGVLIATSARAVMFDMRGMQLQADDPNPIVNTVSTTDATVTTLGSYTIPTDTTVVIETFITARRTGGVSGTAGDSAGYKLTNTYKNVSGTITLVGTLNQAVLGEDQILWDGTEDISGTAVRVRVTGASGNNISWKAYRKVMYV